MGVAMRVAMGIVVGLSGISCSGQISQPPGLGGGARGNASVAACAVTKTSPLGAEAATAIDPNVPGDIAMLARRFEVGLHHGDFTCGTAAPSTDGRLFIQPHLRQILLREQAPAFDQIPPATCADYIVYEADITITTDSGTLSGTLASELTVHYLDGLFTLAKSAAQALTGSLGVRVNPARPWDALVAASFTLRPDGATQGQLFSSTNYSDGAEALQDQGDGIFWPVDSPDQGCGWLEAPSSTGSRMVTLDELAAL